MKKYLCLLVCALICLASSCAPGGDTAGSSGETVDSGKYYSICKENATEVRYNIYNSKGETVLSETTDRPLTVGMVSADIVDIGIGMGTGITVHRYYSAEKNLFSQDFSYVLHSLNELVAYIYVPKENSFENRKVVVQNIFDQNVFYKEFQPDFSQVDTPVIKAEFSEDGTSLQLTYLSGEEQTQVSETVKFD